MDNVLVAVAKFLNLLNPETQIDYNRLSFESSGDEEHSLYQFSANNFSSPRKEEGKRHEKLQFQNTRAEVSRDASPVDLHIQAHPVNNRDLPQHQPQKIKNRFPYLKVVQHISKFLKEEQHFPLLYQQSKYKADKMICFIIYLKILQIKHPGTIKQIFRNSEDTFFMSYYYQSNVDSKTGLPNFKKGTIQASILKFYEYYAKRYAEDFTQEARSSKKWKDIDMRNFSAFILKRLILECTDQVLEKVDGERFDNSKGYSLIRIFALLLGPKYHSTQLRLKDLRTDTQRKIYEAFYHKVGESHSILINRHCGMITNKENCLFPQKFKQEPIGLSITKGSSDKDTSGLSFVANVIFAENKEENLQNMTKVVCCFLKDICSKGLAKQGQIRWDSSNLRKQTIEIGETGAKK